MIAPARYLRKAYANALQYDVNLYDGFAPEDAQVPYGVITSIEAVQTNYRCVQWECTVTLALYIEFQEYGGNKSIDEITDDVITAVGADGSGYLPVDNFTPFGIQVLSISNDVTELRSLKIFRVILRIQHNLSA